MSFSRIHAVDESVRFPVLFVRPRKYNACQAIISANREMAPAIQYVPCTYCEISVAVLGCAASFKLLSLVATSVKPLPLNTCLQHLPCVL